MVLPIDPSQIDPEDIGEQQTTLEMSHEDAIEHVRDVFSDAGFGVPVEFSPSDMLNEKIDAGRDPLDAVLGGELLVRVDVDLCHCRSGFGGHRFDDGFEHLAGATPVCVEVDQNDVVLGGYVGQLGFSIDRDWLGNALWFRLVGAPRFASVTEFVQFLPSDLL